MLGVTAYDCCFDRMPPVPIVVEISFLLIDPLIYFFWGLRMDWLDRRRFAELSARPGFDFLTI